MTYIGGGLRKEDGGREWLGLVRNSVLLVSLQCTYKDILELHLPLDSNCDASQAILELSNES